MRSSRTGIRFDPLTPIERWKALGARIAAHSDATCWWLGDWLTFGRMKYGRRYKEGIALTGLEYQTLRNYAVVARRFDMCRRREALSFQHHAEVCALSDDDQDLWLELAAQHRWSRHELRRRVRGSAAPLPVAATSVVRFTVEADREQRWREAAESSHSPFEVWISVALDDAAGVALSSRT